MIIQLWLVAPYRQIYMLIKAMFRMESVVFFPLQSPLIL